MLIVKMLLAFVQFVGSILAVVGFFSTAGWFLIEESRELPLATPLGYLVIGVVIIVVTSLMQKRMSKR